MRLIIAGSKNRKPKFELLFNLLEFFGISTHPEQILTNGTYGVAAVAKWYARCEGIPLVESGANWRKYGGSKARDVRDKALVQNADALLLIWDGSSQNCASIKSHAERAGLKVYEVQLHRCEGGNRK